MPRHALESKRTCVSFCACSYSYRRGATRSARAPPTPGRLAMIPRSLAPASRKCTGPCLMGRLYTSCAFPITRPTDIHVGPPWPTHFFWGSGLASPRPGAGETNLGTRDRRFGPGSPLEGEGRGPAACPKAQGAMRKVACLLFQGQWRSVKIEFQQGHKTHHQHNASGCMGTSAMGSNLNGS